MIIYLDGRFVPEEEAKVSVFDHGLLYGDGVFEGIRAYNGKVFRLDEHVDRLYDSAKTINLAIPHTKEEFSELILETLRKNDLRDAYIRPVVTRGKGDLGLDPRKLFEVLHLSSGQCRALDNAVPKAILPRDFSATFTVEGMIKDLECALRTARENGVRLLLPAVAQQVYQEARGLGHGGEHLAAVIQPMEMIAGVEVGRKEPPA